MNFTFDGIIAKEYGIPEAVLLHNIAFWEKQNRLNQHNFFAGRYWSYNTIKAYEGLFDFMSTATIKRALKHLKDEGLILTGNFNNDRFNHTNYYTLSDKGMSILQNCAIRLDHFEPIESSNLSLSIFNNNTNSTDKNITDKNIPPIMSPEETLFEQFWEVYPKCFRKTNKKGCKARFIKIKNLKEIFPDIISSLEMQKRSKQWNDQDGQFIPAPLTWINQERWTVTDDRTELQQKIDEATEQNIEGFLF